MALPEALSDLRDFLGDRLSTATPVLLQHSQSESHIRAPAPNAVAFPQDSAEVARIAAICARHAVPIVGWGAGTSLEGHALAVKGGLTVDFRLMNKVLAVYPEDMPVSYTHLDVYKRQASVCVGSNRPRRFSKAPRPRSRTPGRRVVFGASIRAI